MNSLIDDKDKHILAVLSEHANYTTRQIAKKTLLPATTINNRIRKMKKEGVIKTYTIIPNYASIEQGFSAHILINVDIQHLKKTKKTQYDVVKKLKAIEHVKRVDVVSGGTDIIVFVRVRDVKEFDTVLLSKIQLIDGIKNTQSLIVIHSQD